MAFKKNNPGLGAADTPARLFQTLTRRDLPDVMTHQRDMLEAYHRDALDDPDVALQLPTGSGKTLVGLLIAEWRRRKFNERVVYLCPTRQLVNQTCEQAEKKYGIDVIAFNGKKQDYKAAAKAAYTTGTNVAVTTYSSLFNVNPFFKDPDVIIVDDAHAAENYIAAMWSLQIPAGDAAHADLHAAISSLLQNRISDQAYARLTGEWQDSSDATWIDKVPSTTMMEIQDRLTAVLDANSDASDDVKYRWSVLRGHLDACHLYMASREIVIRPLMPPVWTHSPFAGAKQRIYMSATLGAGGDLERLTGSETLKRLPAPEGFRSTGVGRRFFIFPGLSLDGSESEKLRLRLQKMAGRSVVLTPSDAAAAVVRKQIDKLDGFERFTAADIENSKQEFVQSEKAVAIMAGRFDGIDFPHEECRLLCLDGLPRATNAQERFLMVKMGATALFNERLQTRILQAAGRCTRALQDRSAVFVTGHELLDYLADDRNWSHFHPELQAELAFGVNQSKDVEASAIVDNFKSFLVNKKDWAEANDSILESTADFTQHPYPAMDVLQASVPAEIRYQKALWMGDRTGALQHAREVAGILDSPKLLGYRALWHYLAGSVAWSLSKSEGDGYARMAQEQFTEAMSAAPAVGWLAALAPKMAENVSSSPDLEAVAQAEGLEGALLAFGTVSERGFEKKAKGILEALKEVDTFSEGLADLGELLGFAAGRQSAAGGPDVWWLGQGTALVFECHASGKPNDMISTSTANATNAHPKWLKESIAGTASLGVVSVLVSKAKKAQPGAKAALKDVRFWGTDDLRTWARNSIGVLRRLKGTLPPDGDLFWRDDARATLVDECLTMDGITSGLEEATAALGLSK